MSKKINILIALIICVIMCVPNVLYANNDYKLGVAMRDRQNQFDLPAPSMNSVFVGDKNNCEIFMMSLNELNNTVDLTNKTYFVLCDTKGTTTVDLIAFVFDGNYDVACLFSNLSYERIIDDENANDLPYSQTHWVKPEHYDDDIFNNGYGKIYMLYSTSCNLTIYKSSVNLSKNIYTVWNESTTRNCEFIDDGNYWKSYGYDTSVGDNYYTFLSGNTRLYLQPDLFINHYDDVCSDCRSSYDRYEFNSTVPMHCVYSLWEDLTNYNQGAIYTNNGYDDGVGGGSDSSEHHVYLKDFSANIVTKNRLDKKYNLRDFVDGEASQPLYLSLGYTLDKYQSENLYDYQLKVDISDVNGNVNTRLMPLSLSGVTYIPLQSVLSDANYSWSNNLRFYEVSRSTTAFKGDNVVMFSYSYDTTIPVYDSSGDRIYPDWNSHKDIMNVSCKLVYKENTSNNYSKSFRFYGGSDENDDGIGENENPYQPDNDDYDGDDSVEPTPNEPSYNGDGINIVINNTNNNDDDDDDDIDLTIYDDDYTDNELRQDLDDGFGLIDNLDTPENDDGYLGLVTEFFSVSIDKDFKKVIMFGISSIVTIAILRFILRR